MDANGFEPNSNKYKEQKAMDAIFDKKVEKVVIGSATKKKRTLLRRFGDIFLSEDVGDVKTYIIYDVLIPAVRENIVDLINSAVGMLFLGEASRRGRRPGNSNTPTGSRINYGGYYGDNRRERMPTYTRARVARNFDEVVFDTRNDAELVLDGMLDILGGESRQVSVADFYDLAGISTSFTDNSIGWTDLRTARIEGSPSRGYVIVLPKCVDLN